MNKDDIETLVAKMPQSVLVTGYGADKTLDQILVVAKEQSFDVLELDQEDLSTASGSLGIDFIKRLKQTSKTKSVKPRLFVVRNSHKLTHQAQNAFLKVLEEPSESTYFLLSTISKSELLPSVISRVRTVSSIRLTKEESTDIIKKAGVNVPKKQAQIMFMAAGLEDELLKLVSDNEYFEIRVTHMKNARTLIEGGGYQKVITINQYKDDRAVATKLIDDICKILRSSSTISPHTKNFLTVNKLLEAKENIAQNGNPRIWLMRALL